MQSDWRSRRDRVRQILDELKMDKTTFCERLSISEAQYYRWIRSDVDSRYAAVPGVNFVIRFCAEFDISPTYILFGVGRKWLSEIQTLADTSDALISTNKQVLEDVVIPFISDVKSHMEEIKKKLL